MQEGGVKCEKVKPSAEYKKVKEEELNVEEVQWRKERVEK